MAKSLWKGIADEYAAKIERGEYPTGSRLPTSSQLAEQVGVSLVTAHKALEELQRLGLVVRAGRKGTIVSPRDRHKTGRIALIFDQIDFAQSFPPPELLAGIHAGLPANTDLVICDAKGSVDHERELLAKMAAETDGVICWPIGDEASAGIIEKIVDSGKPLVLLDRIPGDVSADAILTDSVSATRQAAEFLIARGHRDVALLSFDKPKISTVNERCGTFSRIMAEHDLHTPDLVRMLPASLEVQDRAHFDQVFNDAMFMLLNGPSKATAVFCVQDILGLAALKYAEAMDLRLPEDLEIVTFNDWPPHWLGRPWLAHRIAVQPADMGRKAISRLLEQMEGAGGPLQTHHIPTRFIPADALVDSAFGFDTQRPQEVLHPCNEKHSPSLNS